MHIRFLGAARTVTGSRFLLETGNANLLVDCGLCQERECRMSDREPFPVPPSDIGAVVLTHAHLDHCGYLPRLVRQGFGGKVFCTPPTAEIVRIALLDAAKLQEEDIRNKNERHQREGRQSPYEPLTPLYTTQDAQDACTLLETVPFRQSFPVSPETTLCFHEAGHILGAASVRLEVRENEKSRTVVFSGDIGRWDRPILPDPSLIERADTVCMEATYGNRVHEGQDHALAKLEHTIRETVESGGNLIVPTFAIERAQEVLFYLSRLFRKGRIPPIPVFLDSPMAIDVTEVFRRHQEYFDEESKDLLRKGESFLDFPFLNTARTVEESKAINSLSGSSIIMAGSGMCTGGRIKHHLVRTISSARNTILFVGYQARGTLGREILEVPPEVRILGRTYPLKARIRKINGFSAHADSEELVRWFSGFQNKPEKVFIIHGESEAAEAFSGTLREKFGVSAVVPDILSRHEV